MPGYDVTRIGHISSVVCSNPFKMDIRISKNHYVFLRPEKIDFAKLSVTRNYSGFNDNVRNRKV